MISFIVECKGNEDCKGNTLDSKTFKCSMMALIVVEVVDSKNEAWVKH
jgi:hypothetical protein